MRMMIRWVAVMGILAGGPAAVRAQQFLDQTAARFPVELTGYTNQLTIGDLDGDGDLDIVFADGGDFSSPGANQRARVYMNNGLGFFTDETATRTGNHSGLHRGVELGDCENDGDLDILLVQDFNRLPNLLINDGTGDFTVEGATRLPNITLSSSRGQFGDVDNDGDLDIFVVNGGANRFGCGQHRLYLNDGTCHYTDATATHVPTANLCEGMDIIFGDIDGDFDIDLRTASTASNQSRLYRNNGSGVFTNVATPADANCYSYDFGDMDGDGDLDLLGANANPTTANAELLLKNDGSGGYTNVSSQISPNPTDDDNDSKFFDYDNDGDMDLVIGRIGGAEKIYNNNGAGFFTQVAGVIQLVSDSTLDVKVADLTGDGALDIVTGQGESGNYQDRIYINTGPADTQPPTVVATEMVAGPDSDGPYVVRALVLDQMSSDRNFLDDGIVLSYSVDAGPTLDVPMRHSGGQVYRGSIPGQAQGSNVEYYVEATDLNGNTGIGDVEAFQVPSCAGVNGCSGHGNCTAVNVCACHTGWEGADCATLTPLPAGAVPAGEGTTRPIKLRKLPGGLIRINWDPSCLASDDDFAVYEGALGAFSSHAPLVCSTLGAMNLSFVPDGGSVYYLVVARGDLREGSYGLDGDGTERPAGTSVCVPQGVPDCD